MGVRYGIDQSGLTDEYGVDLTTYGEDVHLNGYQTLAYCRIRELDSDMSRAERQRKVLVALLGKAKSLSAMELTALMSTASQYVETNLNLDYILQIALQVLEGDLAHVDQLRLPLNKTYVSETRNEHAMLYDCDWTANTEALYDHIYGG